MAAPLSFEFEKTVSGSHLIGKSELSAGKVHFSECLFERSTSSSSNPMPYSTTEVIISNGNRTEWSPIRSVIIRVITKSDDCAAGVRFVYHEYDYRPNLTT